jgi:hypothetical protein
VAVNSGSGDAPCATDCMMHRADPMEGPDPAGMLVKKRGTGRSAATPLIYGTMLTMVTVGEVEPDGIRSHPAGVQAIVNMAESMSATDWTRPSGCRGWNGPGSGGPRPYCDQVVGPHARPGPRR